MPEQRVPRQLFEAPPVSSVLGELQYDTVLPSRDIRSGAASKYHAAGTPMLDGTRMNLASLILLGCAVFACAMPLPAQTPPAAAAATRRADALITEMRGRLQEDRLIEPPGESAADVLRVLNREAADRPEILELSRELFERLLQKGKAAMRARAYDRSARLLQAAREAGAFLDDPALEQAESELKAAKERDVPLPPLRR